MRTRTLACEGLPRRRIVSGTRRGDRAGHALVFYCVVIRLATRDRMAMTMQSLRAAPAYPNRLCKPRPSEDVFSEVRRQAVARLPRWAL